MQKGHRKQMKMYQGMDDSLGKLIFALALLSDVVDGDMIGKQRDIHIQDAKEAICEFIRPRKSKPRGT